MGRGLIIFPGALGDLLCLVPTVRALARRYPEVTYELMARSELARFAVGRMGVAAAHSIDRREVAELFTARPSDRARGFFGQFQRIDSFFAADQANVRCALRRVTDANVRFYPFRPTGPGHIAEAYLRAAGEPAAKPLNYSIEFLPADLDRARLLLNTRRLDPDHFLLILPGSGSHSKNWPGAYFARLAQRMAGQALIVLGPAEAELEQIFVSNAQVLLKNLELGQVAALARLARFFIGNDSGVSHLAAAAGVPGLVLFGPSDPQRWCPLGKVTVIRREWLPGLGPDEVWNMLQSKT